FLAGGRVEAPARPVRNDWNREREVVAPHDEDDLASAGVEPGLLVVRGHEALAGGAVGRFVSGRNYALALVAQDRQHRLLVTALEGVHERLRGLFDRVEAALRGRTGSGRR